MSGFLWVLAGLWLLAVVVFVGLCRAYGRSLSAPAPVEGPDVAVVIQLHMRRRTEGS